MEFLSNPIWQLVINVSVAILAVIVAIAIYRKQTRKEFAFEVITDTPILSIRKEVKGKVQVSLGNAPVDNARLVILKLWNLGNISISPNDYIEPLKLSFGDDAVILDADVLETIPSEHLDTVKASLKQDRGSIKLEPLLLNRGDSITLKVLVTQPQITKEIKVNARIIGISKILHFDKASNPRRSIARTAIYCSYLVYLASVIYFLFSRYESSFINKLIIILTIVLLAVTYILVIILILSMYSIFSNRLGFRTSIKRSVKVFVLTIRYMIDDTKYSE